ncbi:MAG: GTPase Era, partial [Ruminococcaceae bacterium]|nr:GTPase Era [Oscillospiraceae bacterium]
MRTITSLMPCGEPYYSDEYLTDKPERFVISEMIREKAMLALSDEIPYGIGVQIVTMSERSDKPLIDIEANIYCERSSHKGIVIGKNGMMLKKIGTNARAEIEALLGINVNLKLWV